MTTVLTSCCLVRAEGVEMPDLWVGGTDNGKLGVDCEKIAFSIVLPR